MCLKNRVGTGRHAGVVETAAVTGGENVAFGAVGAAGDWLLIGQVPPAAGRRGGGAASANAPPQPAGKVYAVQERRRGGYAYQSTLIFARERDPRATPSAPRSSSPARRALIGANGTARRTGLVHEFELMQRRVDPRAQLRAAGRRPGRGVRQRDPSRRRPGDRDRAGRRRRIRRGVRVAQGRADRPPWRRRPAPHRRRRRQAATSRGRKSRGSRSRPAAAATGSPPRCARAATRSG